MNQLNHEDNQFLDRLADRSLPEPSEASRDTIFSYAAAHLAEPTQRPLPPARHSHYQQLSASIIAASVVLILLGVCWYGMSEKKQNIQPDSQNQIATDSTEELQPTDPKALAAAEALDPMAFDDNYGRLAVDSTKQRINSFWSNDASWQQSRSTPSVDQRLSTVRYRIEQLKKRSELDELFRRKPKKEEGGQFDHLEPYRYVWFDTPWYLFNHDA